MVVLGIDFGLKNIGLAIATGPLAEPLANVKVSSKLYEQLRQICFKLQVKEIVVGISEGKMAHQTRKFAEKLTKELNITIAFQDETLTTQQAIQKLAEASKKAKRRGPKHAFAATLILQEYLDRKKEEK